MEHQRVRLVDVGAQSGRLGDIRSHLALLSTSKVRVPLQRHKLSNRRKGLLRGQKRTTRSRKMRTRRHVFVAKRLFSASRPVLLQPQQRGRLLRQGCAGQIRDERRPAVREDAKRLRERLGSHLLREVLSQRHLPDCVGGSTHGRRGALRGVRHLRRHRDARRHVPGRDGTHAPQLATSV